MIHLICDLCWDETDAEIDGDPMPRTRVRADCPTCKRETDQYVW